MLWRCHSFLLNYNWHAILHWFQVYNTVIQYFYTWWNDHHNKSSYCPSVELPDVNKLIWENYEQYETNIVQNSDETESFFETYKLQTWNKKEQNIDIHLCFTHWINTWKYFHKENSKIMLPHLWNTIQGINDPIFANSFKIHEERILSHSF